MRTAAALPARAPRSAWPTAARTSRFRRSAAAGASARDAQPLGRQGTEKRRTHRRGERQRLRRWRLRRWRHIGDLRSRFKRRESSQVLRRNVLKLKPGASGGLHGAPPQRRPGPARESCAETRSSAGENKLPGRRVGLASQAGPTHRPRSIDDSCPLLQRSYVVDTHRGGQCKHTSAQKAWWERAWSGEELNTRAAQLGRRLDAHAAHQRADQALPQRRRGGRGAWLRSHRRGLDAGVCGKASSAQALLLQEWLRLTHRRRPRSS